MMIEFDNADVDEPFRVYLELDQNGTLLLRKVESYREDGTPIFQDTNNSTADFDVQATPAIRRHGVKRPAWSANGAK